MNTFLRKTSNSLFLEALKLTLCAFSSGIIFFFKKDDKSETVRTFFTIFLHVFIAEDVEYGLFWRTGYKFSLQ